jgi:hypothetical protein
VVGVAGFGDTALKDAEGTDVPSERIAHSLETMEATLSFAD